MNSRVRFEVGGARRIDRTLVYPWDADELTGRLSVLSPLGSALLGLKVGDTIAWSLPDGTAVDVRVIALLYQPEAAGDHWL
ncbi:MAG: GreA/GreB family elongation factor [Polyangiales bacterium]